MLAATPRPLARPEVAATAAAPRPPEAVAATPRPRRAPRSSPEAVAAKSRSTASSSRGRGDQKSSTTQVPVPALAAVLEQVAFRDGRGPAAVPLGRRAAGRGLCGNQSGSRRRRDAPRRLCLARASWTWPRRRRKIRSSGRRAAEPSRRRRGYELDSPDASGARRSGVRTGFPPRPRPAIRQTPRASSRERFGASIIPRRAPVTVVVFILLNHSTTVRTSNCSTPTCRTTTSRCPRRSRRSRRQASGGCITRTSTRLCTGRGVVTCRSSSQSIETSEGTSRFRLKTTRRPGERSGA